jgi:hypothetical protein
VSGTVSSAAFLVGLGLFLALLSVGVVRRWHWVFWLVVVAFLAGALRVPYAALQLAGLAEPSGPPWYELLQAAVGVAQVVIAALLLKGYRKGGVWADF